MTIMQAVEALCAYVRFGDEHEAAHYLGISVSRLAYRLWWFRRLLGAQSTAHLAALAYPVLHPWYVIAHDEPHGTVQDARAA